MGDIARAVGVHCSTVSRVLGGKGVRGRNLNCPFPPSPPSHQLNNPATQHHVFISAILVSLARKSPAKCTLWRVHGGGFGA